MRSLSLPLRTCLFVIVALALAAEANARTYYVRTTGSDSLNGRSYSYAFKTIKKAAEVAVNGDRVLVWPGRYTDAVDVNGKQGSSLLQFVATEAGRVTIGGQVHVSNCNAIEFSGMTFAGSRDRLLIWEASYGGSFDNCSFLDGRNPLLIKSGSLTFKGSRLTNFAGDGVEIDGLTKMLVTQSHITGCQGSAIKVLKNALVSIDGSFIKDNVGDGVRVAVDSGSIPTTGSCDCSGTDPQNLKRQAYDLLARINPQNSTYRQAIADARTDISQALRSSLWEDEWTATLAGGPTVYAESKSAIEKLNAIYTDDISFFISGDSVIVSQPFKLAMTVLGAEISYNGIYDVPVTTKFKVGNRTYQPWGSFDSPTQGNVNDHRNPRQFSSEDVHAAGSKLTVSGRSWVKKSTYSSATRDSDWRVFVTVDTSGSSSRLITLRDGDVVPSLQGGAHGQNSAVTFLRPYLAGNRIKLNENQVIFLFELGTGADDFQDLVVLATMQAAHTAASSEELDLIKQAIDLLLEANKQLASCAMTKATCANGHPDAMAVAETEFNTALNDVSAEHFVQASERFGAAWEAAQKAILNPTGGSTTGGTRPPADLATLSEPSITVSASHFTGNNSGLAMLTSGEFSARNSDFSDNGQWGLRVRGKLTLGSCTINGNGETGVYLEDGKSSDVDVTGLTLTDNVKYGLFAKNSDLAFDAAEMRNWGISGSQTVIAGDGSAISFENMTVSGGSTAAVSMVDGAMKAAFVTFSDSGYGVSVTNSDFALYDCTLSANTVGLHAVKNKSMRLQGTKFINNDQWGVKLSGVGHFTGATISGNGTGGVELTDTSGSDVSFTRTTVNNNNTYGLYCSGSTLTFETTNFGGLALEGHDYQIYGDKASDLSFSAFTVKGGNKYAVYVANSKLAAKGSTFTGAATGLGSYQNTSCELGDCTFNNNTKFGLHVDGGATVAACTIEGNGSGVLLENTNHTLVRGGDQLKLTDNTIQDNSEVGVYASAATLTIDSTLLGRTTITGSKTLFAGFKSSLTFDGITLSGGSQYGIANYSGKVAVNNCTLSGNGIGLYSDYGCSATGSTFTGNATAGASVQGAATFTSCVFEKNPNGLQITNDTTGEVQLVSSEIKDNTLYGVWCDSCTFTFDASMQAGWSVQNNGSNFGATGSTLTFSGFTVSNGTTYGVVCEQGTLNLTNSTLTANGTGAYIDSASTLVASGTKFAGNKLYGASMQGKATLQNCLFDSNTHGLQFANMSAGEVKCSGTTVSNNTQYGLHLESCTLTLTGSGIDGLKLSDNNIGIHSTNSTLVFDNFTSDSNSYGAWLDSSDVTMTNSEFTGSTYGLWATDNKKLSVDSSTFSGNSAYGVYLIGSGSFHNCSITGNTSGLYLNTTTIADANLTGTDISGNTTYGVYAYRGSLDLSAQPAEGWSIGSNGYNIATYEADLSLKDATVTDANRYGVYARYGNVDVDQSTITSKSGGIWSWYGDSFTLDRSHVTGSNTGSWAVVNYDSGMAMRNTVVSGARYGVFSYDLSKSAVVYNSTIADAQLYGLYASSGDLAVVNTIISANSGTYGLYRRTSANVTHTHNLVYGFSSPFLNTTADASEIQKDPRFVDAANQDFRLSKGSPAINQGTDLTASHTVDMLGAARPSHRVFEIGAYEYTASGGSFRVLDWQENK